MSAPHLFFLLFICIVWGLTFVVGKAALEEFSPILFTAIRYSFLALVLLPFLKIHPGQMRAIAALALTAGSIHFAIFYAGLALSNNVAATAIAVQMGVPFATCLSVVFLRETIGWKRICGITAAFGGLLVIGLDPVIFQDFDSLALVLLAAFIGAIGMVIMRVVSGVNPFELQAWIAMLSWPLLILISLIFETGQIEQIQNAGWRGWGGILYTGLGASLIGHAGMFWLLQRYEISLIAPLTLLAPLFGAIFGVLLLGDEVTIRMTAGGLLALAGVFIVNLRQTEQTPHDSVALTRRA